ncbi:hypothetical protein D3OALGA1CA_5309 [Olavius algarvensis associated proteobacterium Delta 3]|nr:hypothetical protein D3OALGA1CA_5309 [Olavius algarvensis associated proteobacterium Delta 3]
MNLAPMESIAIFIDGFYIGLNAVTLYPVPSIQYPESRIQYPD